jgi:hypothetical protein
MAARIIVAVALVLATGSMVWADSKTETVTKALVVCIQQDAAGNLVAEVRARTGVAGGGDYDTFNVPINDVTTSQMRSNAKSFMNTLWTNFHTLRSIPTPTPVP